MEEKHLKPLSSVKAGETVTLVSINAGQALNSRLASMGLVPNVELTVVNNRHPGPFVISVKDCKMMLGKGISHKIMVL
ncbi:MAG: ferrous iron transport protein A [Planctomycetota bacterium]|nr:MAG: ferrous iron transport protein A [Planctomycetota bacterium]